MIIGSICEECDVEKAKRLLREMKGHGCAPNNVMYNVIVQSLLRKDKVLKAIYTILGRNASKEICRRSCYFFDANRSIARTVREDDYLLKLMKNVLPKEIFG